MVKLQVFFLCKIVNIEFYKTLVRMMKLIVGFQEGGRLIADAAEGGIPHIRGPAS